jgi:hypothetical protein
MRATIIIFLTISLSMLKAQENTKSTFDFWLGNWNAYWSDSLRGINTITKILKDNVVEEHFVFNDKSFVGRSWTVFDSKNAIWKQTWVDDAGAYLTFTGGQEGDKVILRMTDKKVTNGKTVSMRMVFYNINKDSFDWDWQSSEDEKNWKSVWLINYKRKK